MKHCRNSQILRLRHPRPPPEVRYLGYIFGVQIPHLSLGGGPGCLGNCHHFFNIKIPRKTSKSTGLRAKASLKASVGFCEIHQLEISNSIATYGSRGPLGFGPIQLFVDGLEMFFCETKRNKQRNTGKKIYEKWYKNQWCYKKGESGRWRLPNGSLAITTRKGAIIKWYKMRIYKHEYKYILNSHDLKKEWSQRVLEGDYRLWLWLYNILLHSEPLGTWFCTWVPCLSGCWGGRRWLITDISVEVLEGPRSQNVTSFQRVGLIGDCDVLQISEKIGNFVKDLEKFKDFFEILQKPKGSIQNSKVEHSSGVFCPTIRKSPHLGPPYTMGATSSMEAISAPGWSHGK